MGKAFNISSLEEMCDLMCGNMIPESEEQDKGEQTMGYECFHCGHKAVIWDGDFDFADYDYEGEGIVHNCHCTHCGADIEYRISFSEEDIEEAIRLSGEDNE